MRCYSVKQISDILNTNPETVRRWIRSGKLEAQQESRKEGNLVHETALQEFIKANPKYAGSKAALLVGPAIVSTAIIEGLVAQKGIAENQIKKSQISIENVKNFVMAEIVSKKASIATKEKIIDYLQSEIQEDQAKIDELVKLINALDTFDAEEYFSSSPAPSEQRQP